MRVFFVFPDVVKYASHEFSDHGLGTTAQHESQCKVPI
jgi:hypothetical protein